MKPIVTRGITGSIYVISVILAIFLHPIVCAVYFAVIALVGMWEFCDNARFRHVYPQKILSMLLGLLLYVYVTFYNNCSETYTLPVLVLMVLNVTALFITELYRKKEKPFTDIAYGVLGAIYVAFPLALTNRIIMMDGYTPVILMSVFIFAWCNDTFAYLTGMKFGRHKLFERHSPKKTWEGSIGGFLFVMIAAVIVSLCDKSLMLYDYLAIGLLTTVVGTLGDLVESMFKRQMGIKDSGKILPGHGGILDRFDILLMLLPVVWVYLKIRFTYL